MSVKSNCYTWTSTDLLDVRSSVRGRCCGEPSTRSFPDREPGRQRSGKDDAFRLCMCLIMAIIGIYILFSILLIGFMPYIIEACVEKGQVELIDFDLGPPPIWISDWPTDFLNIPPGADIYVNISFSLSIANNPWWLMVDMFAIDIRVGWLGSIFAYPHNRPVYSNGTLQFRQLVPWSDLNEGLYICLIYARSIHQTIILDVGLGANFSIFGYHSRGYKLKTSVTDRSQRRDGIIPNPGNKLMKGCLRHLVKHTTQALGRITAIGEFDDVDPELQFSLDRAAELAKNQS